MYTALVTQKGKWPNMEKRTPEKDSSGPLKWLGRRIFAHPFLKTVYCIREHEKGKQRIKKGQKKKQRRRKTCM